jgi:hypothetical protein
MMRNESTPFKEAKLQAGKRVTEDINSKYLASVLQKANLERAEEWAIANGYFTPEGEWCKLICELAAFLQVLIDVGVLNDTVPRKEIDQYFASRFNCQLMNEIFNLSKIKESRKKLFYPLHQIIIEIL